MRKTTILSQLSVEEDLLNNENTNVIQKNNEYKYPFPSTRYQGSKLKIVDWIWSNIKDIEFETVLDAFGGTACVSHLLKRKGKEVFYNDLLEFNYIIGKALIENKNTLLNEDDVKYILTQHSNVKYPSFIFDNFSNIFYLDEENRWLDIIVTNIRNIKNPYKQALAWFSLFQACIIKRPYNLFHRANLYIRTNTIKRNFGNKTTWDASFENHFRKFVLEANNAVFDNNKSCVSMNYDAFKIPYNSFDLIYIDTPYITAKGVGTDYLDFYHFLEGMVNYDNWKELMLDKYKHLPIQGKGENIWTKKNHILQAFERLIEKFKDSILVISYRKDGIPSEEEIFSILKKYKKEVGEVQSKNYKYVLSHNSSNEILFIAK